MKCLYDLDSEEEYQEIHGEDLDNEELLLERDGESYSESDSSCSQSKHNGSSIG